MTYVEYLLVRFTKQQHQATAILTSVAECRDTSSCITA